MSVFSNSASDAAGSGQAYTDALCALVEGRDPLDVLRATPPAIRAVLDAMSDQERVTPEVPGKWCVRHVVQHLADSEVAWGWRLRLLLAHDRPTFTPYDQDLWAKRLRYHKVDTEHAYDEFRALREGHVRLLERSSPDDLDRVGIHAEWGEVTLRRLLAIEAGHDVLHLRQIERIRRAIGSLA